MVTDGMENYASIIEKINAFSIREGFTSFVNPYSMLLLKDKDKEDLVNSIDYWYVDGMSLVKMINILYGKNICRYSFDDTSVAPLVFCHARNNHLPLAIVGTKEDMIGLAVKNIEHKYELKVQYFRHGYFTNDDELKETIAAIIDNDIKVILCGMGTLYQERFLIKLKEAGWKGFGYTCGGYLHQIAKNKNYYPRFFDKYNLRWVYRIYDEPILAGRYFIKYPIFLFKFLVIRIKNK